MKEEIKKALEWRYATKQFDKNKKIKPADFEVLKEALRLAPNSFGLQAWKFLIIENKDIREKLKAVAWNQPQITDASHLIVLCARTDVNSEDIGKFVSSTSNTRGVSVESLKGMKELLFNFRKDHDENSIVNWTKRQVYIALGFVLEAAALMKIDACPMEGFNAAEFDNILGLKEKGLASAVICALGYRSDKDPVAKMKKVRYSSKDMFETR